MSISLQKGQKISLMKDNAGLGKVMVGLGWDPVQEKKGLLGGLFGGASADVDCDASVFMLDENGKMTQKKDIVYYGHLMSDCGSIKHMGDNLTGEGEGDDEQVMVNLAQVPQNVNKLLFVVNIYNASKRNQHFGMIQNAFIRIVDMSNNSEILKYNLTEQYSGKTAIVAGELYRNNGDWKFGAIGEGTDDPSLSTLAKKYGL